MHFVLVATVIEPDTTLMEVKSHLREGGQIIPTTLLLWLANSLNKITSQGFCREGAKEQKSLLNEGDFLETSDKLELSMAKCEKLELGFNQLIIYRKI